MLCYLRRDKPKYGWISKKFHPNINNKYHPNIKKNKYHPNINNKEINNRCISQLLSRCCCTADWDLYIFYWYLDDIFIDIWMIFLLTFGYFYWYLDIFIDIWMIFVRYFDDIFFEYFDVFIDICIFLLRFGWYLFDIHWETAQSLHRCSRLAPSSLKRGSSIIFYYMRAATS